MRFFRPDTRFPEPLSLGQHLGQWLWWAGSTASVCFLLGGAVVGIFGFFGQPSGSPYAGIDGTTGTALLRLTLELANFGLIAALCWIGGRLALFLFASK